MSVMWFRSDFRLEDNKALFNACQHQALIALYIFDDDAPSLGPSENWWLHKSLRSLQESIEKKGNRLCIRRGKPEEVLKKITKEHAIEAIYADELFDPYGRKKQRDVQEVLQKSCTVQFYNNHLLIHPESVLTKEGNYYKVFSSFWKKALLSIQEELTLSCRLPKGIPSSSEQDSFLLHGSLEKFWHPGEENAKKQLDRFIEEKLERYAIGRDFPKEDATSLLSAHLHMGEISPRVIFNKIQALQDTKKPFLQESIDCFLSELGWREFSYYLLYHYPDLPFISFDKKFSQFPWTMHKEHFNLWKQGKTGYPIVDAGMRQLLSTGWMHNRVRMIVASFLTKHLLIPWQEGAAWFLENLVDADLANNSMNWQWVAGCGLDAAPFFRIFNPIIQGEKFDPDGVYVRTWCPELASLPNKWVHRPWEAPKTISFDYPKRVVIHEEARKRALDFFNSIKKS